MNFDDFHALDGWLDRWKKRYNISFKMVSGEAIACTSEVVASREESTLQTILSKYIIAWQQGFCSYEVNIYTN